MISKIICRFQLFFHLFQNADDLSTLRHVLVQHLLQDSDDLPGQWGVLVSFICSTMPMI